MIRLHRLNGQEVVLNAELLESVEAHGVETVIVMANGNRMIVTEKVTEVIEKCLEYRKKVYVGAVYFPEFLKLKKEGGTPC
jgi:flagellar protein FlbD